MDFDLPEKMDNDNNFLNEPGSYHFAVLAVDENPTTKGGNMIDGFKVHLCALDGTVAGQAKRELELMFFAPKMSEKNNGEFSKRKIARFAFATGILPATEAGARVSIDLQQAVGRQFVAEVEKGKDQQGNETKFLQLAWANLYHVDDPAVAQVPKDAAALSLLPAALRKKPEDFAQKKPNKVSPGAANIVRQAQLQHQPAAGAGAVNLDDL